MSTVSMTVHTRSDQQRPSFDKAAFGGGLRLYDLYVRFCCTGAICYRWIFFSKASVFLTLPFNFG